jgi:hypothetical protein
MLRPCQIAWLLASLAACVPLATLAQLAPAPLPAAPIAIATDSALSAAPTAWLALLAEPSLALLSRQRIPGSYRYAEHYRFVFEGSSVGRSLRVRVLPTGAELIIKRFDPSTRKLISGERKLLTQSQLNMFRAYLKIASLGSLPEVDTRGGASNQRWWLETAVNGNYRSFARLSPNDIYFREACLYLTRLIGEPDSVFLFQNPRTGMISG